MHWHRLSYDVAGNVLADATGSFISSSTINDSANRCITIHATNGVVVRDNICVDIVGHGVFLEDAVERRNVIEVQGFVLDQGNERYNARMPIDVTRFAADGTDVGHWTIGNGNLISAFQNMRHFAAQHDGRFLIDFPGSTMPNDVGLTVENAPTSDDDVVLGIRFAGTNPAQVYASTYYNYFQPGHAASGSDTHKHDDAPVASLAAVQASAGETYWQDATNNIVWVKVQGGLEQYWNDSDYGPTTDQQLYRSFNLRVH